jgi:hypothetical protein
MILADEDPDGSSLSTAQPVSEPSEPNETSETATATTVASFFIGASPRNA